MLTSTKQIGESSAQLLPVCLATENSNGLVSLWDMLEILASALAEIPEMLACIWADYLGGENADPREVEEAVTKTVAVCEKIGWTDIANQGQRFLNNARDPKVSIEGLKALADDFREAVRGKFEGLQVVAIEERDRDIFANATLEFCGGPLHPDLAVSEEEFNLAGRALGFELSTAAVSHAMRSVEAGLHVLALALPISFSGAIQLHLNYAHDQGSEREFRLADAARS